MQFAMEFIDDAESLECNSWHSSLLGNLRCNDSLGEYLAIRSVLQQTIPRVETLSIQAIPDIDCLTSLWMALSAVRSPCILIQILKWTSPDIAQDSIKSTKSAFRSSPIAKPFSCCVGVDQQRSGGDCLMNFYTITPSLAVDGQDPPPLIWCLPCVCKVVQFFYLGARRRLPCTHPEHFSFRLMHSATSAV